MDTGCNYIKLVTMILFWLTGLSGGKSYLGKILDDSEKEECFINYASNSLSE